MVSGRASTDTTGSHAREKFIAELRKRANVSDAAKAAAIDRSTAYRWRDAEPEFAAAWNDAIETAIDAMEREAHRRAFTGIKKPIVGRVAKDKDGIVAHVTEYSDGLATLLLKAHRPDKYRERQDIHHSGRVDIEYVNDWRRSEN